MQRTIFFMTLTSRITAILRKNGCLVKPLSILKIFGMLSKIIPFKTTSTAEPWWDDLGLAEIVVEQKSRWKIVHEPASADFSTRFLRPLGGKNFSYLGLRHRPWVENPILPFQPLRNVTVFFLVNLSSSQFPKRPWFLVGNFYKKASRCVSWWEPFSRAGTQCNFFLQIKENLWKALTKIQKFLDLLLQN